MRWLASHGVTFEPIWDRQSFEKDGKQVFWGRLTLAAAGEGAGLWEMEAAAFERLGGPLRLEAGVTGLLRDGDPVTVVRVGDEAVAADALILASSRFEADDDPRAEWTGEDWRPAKVRGTPLNTGKTITQPDQATRRVAWKPQDPVRGSGSTSPGPAMPSRTLSPPACARASPCRCRRRTRCGSRRRGPRRAG